MKNKKTGIWLSTLALALLSAIVVYVLLLNIEKNLLTGYEKETIWAVKAEFPEGKKIVEDEMEVYFEQVEMDKKLIPLDVIREVKDYVGYTASIQLGKGTVICQTMFSDSVQISSDMESPVLVGCKAEDLSQVVSGTLRAGDIINIYTINEEGIARLIWREVMVYQTFDSAGNEIMGDDTDSTTLRVNLILEEEQIELFYTELAQGLFKVIKLLK